MFEGVIFDLEGLIVEAEAWQLQAWNTYLKQYELEVGLEEWEEGLAGRQAYNVAEILRHRYDLPQDPLTMTEERQAILLEIVEAQEELEGQPGVVEVFQMFKDNNIKIAIATSDYKDYVWLVLEKLGLDDMLDVLVTGDTVAEIRPNPASLLACAETFATHPANCLALAKDRAGVEAAIMAGMRVICIPGPTVARWRITGADIVLPSFDNLSIMTLRSIWFEADEEPRPQLYRAR